MGSSSMRPSNVTRPMAIRTRMDTRWRIAWTLMFAAVLLGGGFAAFEYGKRAGVADASEAVTERLVLKDRIGELSAELAQLRTSTVTSDSRIQVEKSAQGQLANQLKAAEVENARLREELTFFETLVPGSKDDRLSIQSLRVEPNGQGGEFRYRMLLLAGEVRRGQEFHGSLQLVVNVERDGGAADVITLPETRGATDPSYKLRFRRIQRVEGLFRVEPSAKVRTLQVRILEDGSTQPKATQSFNLM